MSIRESQIYCEACGKTVLGRREGADHRLHFLIAALTCTLWVVPWVFMALNEYNVPLLCPICGTAALVKKRSPLPYIWLAFVGVCLLIPPAGCLLLGVSTMRAGADLVRKAEEAKRLQAQELATQTAACERGDVTACRAAGASYSDTNNPAQNDEKAEAALLRGCDLSDGKACTKAAKLYEFGTAAIPKDAEKHRHFLELGCQRDAGEACRDLAQLHRFESADWARLYDRACVLGEGSSCGEIGHFEQREGRYPHAVELLTRGCDLGHKNSCGQLEKLYSEGVGVPKDETKAGEFRKRASAAKEW